MRAKMMVTFMEVKGQQRSNVVNSVLWLAYLVKRLTADGLSYERWWPLWRSSAVELCVMATIFDQENHWCKLRIKMTFTEVKCGKLCAMATIFGQKNRWCKLRMMTMTFAEVKSQHRSNIVNYAPWLPNLVTRTADTSLGWLWHSWGQQRTDSKQLYVATKLCQKNCW